MHLLAIPSLRWRLISVMVLAYITVAVVTGAASYKAQDTNLHQQLVRQARSDAALLATASIGPLTGNTGGQSVQLSALKSELNYVLSSQLRAQGVTYGFVYAQAGVVAQAGHGEHVIFDVFGGAQTGGLSHGRVWAVAPVIGPTILGYAGVIVSNADIQSSLQQSLLIDLVLGTIGLIIFILLSLVIARYILGPLAVLSRAAEAIRRGQLSARVTVNEGTELSTVAEAFNDMAGALEQRIGHLSFLANSGAVLPTTFRESGDLTQVLRQFCDNLDVCGVCLINPPDDADRDIYYSRDPDATEWQECATAYARKATAPTTGVHDGLAVMAVPVLDGGVFVTARLGSDPFTPQERPVVTNFAYQVGIAADNARLFDAQQEALRVKDQFLSIVSHELRTPLTTIKGYSQMLKRKVADDMEGRRFAETIDAQVARLSRLVDDLLDATRFARGQFDIKREPVNLVPILEDVIARFRLVASQHSLRLEILDDLPSGEWDHDRLEQVMNNLVSNAIKYSPGGGEVTIAAWRESARVVVAVRDQGMGIPEEDQARLFERFYRGSMEGQDIKGMGLGLYVTQRIVEAHGGEISLKSKPGKGSEFRFTLPLVPQPAIVD